MKRSILKGMALFLLLCSGGTLACAQQQKQDTIVVSRDGTGKYRDIQEAVEAVRAFMDYTVTIFIKNGIYKEKLVIPSWVKNVQLVGEDAEKTIITYDDHANINKMGTFRTYTVKVEGSDITFKNLTIENNAAPLGQAVALHTEGDRLMFVGCRFLGNQVLFIQDRRVAACYLLTAILKELQTSSSALLQLCLNIANCIASAIHILPRLLLRRRWSLVMFSRTVS